MIRILIIIVALTVLVSGCSCTLSVKPASTSSVSTASNTGIQTSSTTILSAAPTIPTSMPSQIVTTQLPSSSLPPPSATSTTTQISIPPITIPIPTPPSVPTSTTAPAPISTPTPPPATTYPTPTPNTGTPIPLPTPVTPTLPLPSTTTLPSIPTPTSPTTLYLQITYVSSPVARGSNGLLIAQTVAGAQCNITISYSWGQASAGGTADNNGQVAWNWLVMANETPGNYIIFINARSGTLSGSQSTSFTVQ